MLRIDICLAGMGLEYKVMKIDLTKYDCDELEISGRVQITTVLKKELLEIAKSAEQLENGDGIYFHQDYRRSKRKHHFDISVEQLNDPETESTVEIYYAVVDPGGIIRSKYLPEYLLSRITEGELTTFRCNCSFNIPRERVTASLSTIPVRFSVGSGELDVVYKGVYFTILESGKEIYDLLLRLFSNEEGEPIYRFTFTFTCEDRLSTQLPSTVLNLASDYLRRFIRR